MKPDHPAAPPVPLTQAATGVESAPSARAKEAIPLPGRCSRADMFSVRYRQWQHNRPTSSGEEFPADDGNTDVSPPADGAL